jgi:hypothetical protein
MATFVVPASFCFESSLLIFVTVQRWRIYIVGPFLSSLARYELKPHLAVEPTSAITGLGP